MADLLAPVPPAAQHFAADAAALVHRHSTRHRSRVLAALAGARAGQAAWRAVACEQPETVTFLSQAGSHDSGAYMALSVSGLGPQMQTS